MSDSDLERKTESFSKRGNGNRVRIQNVLQRREKWTHVATMCLLEILWEQYEQVSNGLDPTEKKRMFENTLREMNMNGFDYSKEELMRKYTNLRSAYRRIKLDIHSYKSCDKMTWPYYQIMKEFCKKETEWRTQFLPVTEQSKGSVLRDSSFSPDRCSRSKFLSKLSSPREGTSLSGTLNYKTFSKHWKLKRLSSEHLNLNLELVEKLITDVKRQRSETDENTFAHLQMRNKKNKRSRQVVNEMSQLRNEVKQELTLLSGSINNLMFALKNKNNASS